MVGDIEAVRVQADEEALPFPDEGLDLILSNLSLHWINDVPGAPSPPPLPLPSSRARASFCSCSITPSLPRALPPSLMRHEMLPLSCVPFPPSI